MAAYMGCDLRKLNFINAVILVQDMLEIMLPVEGNHRHSVLVQKEKTGIAVDHRLLIWSFPVIYDPPETIHNLLAHRNISFTTLGFRIFDDIFHPSCFEICTHKLEKGVCAYISQNTKNPHGRSPVKERKDCEDFHYAAFIGMKDIHASRSGPITQLSDRTAEESFSCNSFLRWYLVIKNI